MAIELEDLKILKAAEENADAIWKKVVAWDEFAQDVVGKQLARATIGANIAESYGRLNYGEKFQFLYYSRGSLFETKYWLNRALVRELIGVEEIKNYTVSWSEIARQLNAFANSVKAQRKDNKTQSKSICESSAEDRVATLHTDSIPLFTDPELNWLED